MVDRLFGIKEYTRLIPTFMTETDRKTHPKSTANSETGDGRERSLLRNMPPSYRIIWEIGRDSSTPTNSETGE